MYTLRGAGADIWDTGDQFHFAYKVVSGDFVATMRVTSRSVMPAAAGQWGRHGLMARWSTAPNAKYSLIATLLPTEASPNQPHHPPLYQYRLRDSENEGNRVNYWADDGTFPSEGRSPRWMRLVRLGTAIYGYLSEDDGGRPRRWVLVGSDSEVFMPGQLLVGAFLHSEAESFLGTMKFDNMTIEPIPVPPDLPCEIGDTFAGTDFNHGFGLLRDSTYTARGSGAFWPGVADGRLRLSQDGVFSSATAVWYDLPGSAALNGSGFIAEFDAFMAKSGLPGDVNPADGMTMAVVQDGAKLLGVSGELCTCPGGCPPQAIGEICSFGSNYSCPTLELSCEGGRIGPGGDSFVWLAREVTGDFDFAVQWDVGMPDSSRVNISGIMARQSDDPKSRFTMAELFLGAPLSQAGRKEHLGAGDAGYYDVAWDPEFPRLDFLRLTRRGNVLQAWGSEYDLADGSLDPRDDRNWVPGPPDDWGPSAPATLKVGFAMSYDACNHLGPAVATFRPLGAAGLTGAEGGNLGFGGGKLRDLTEGHPSFAIEIDNWIGGGEPGNDPLDAGSPDYPRSYHFGLDVNAEASSIQTNADLGIPAYDLPDIFDARGIHVTVEYSPGGQIEVSAGRNSPPFLARRVLSARIPPLVGPILLGFTAGTGGASCTQEVDNFVITRLRSCGGPDGAQRPSDCNQDGSLDISDAICLLGHLFLGSPAKVPCGDGSLAEAGNVTLLDANGDSGVDLSDAVRVLGHLFSGSGPPVLGTTCVPLSGCPENAAACGH